MHKRRSARSALAAALVVLTSCGGGGTDPDAVPASITLSAAVVNLASLNATVDLDATVQDAGGAAISVGVAWSSDAMSVATVNNQGVVTAVANGTARVIATAGTVQDTADVTVQQLPASLTLAPDTLRFPSVGDTATIAATVRDAGGSVMSGVTVTFGTSNSGVATVNSSGRVRAEGNGGTNVTGTAAPGGANLTRNVRVEVGGVLAPAYLVGGNVGIAYTDQVGPATGAGGAFTYSVTAGALPPGLGINSSNGSITGTPSGGSAGVHFFEVTATNGTLTLSERYAITISTQPASAFNIWVAYNGGAMPPLNARSALNGALARMENVVTGDIVGSVTYPPTGLDPTDCQLVDASLMNGAVIEDIAILFAVGPIVDGATNTLAQGGPCGYFRQTLPTVISGQMRLDEDDANGSVAFLQDVLWHEMGHVLGLGTFWQGFTQFEATDSVRYYGTSGNAEWRAYGGPADGVPVELITEAHWREGWFNTEIMTPQAEGPGTPQPISRMTIGSLIDLGYGAVLGAADAYSLPVCRPACPTPSRSSGEEGRERVPDVVFDRLKPLPERR